MGGLDLVTCHVATIVDQVQGVDGIIYDGVLEGSLQSFLKYIPYT